MIAIYQKDMVEDLDQIIDASDPDKTVVNGYHVCEVVILGKNDKQSISVLVKSILVRVL